MPLRLKRDGNQVFEHPHLDYGYAVTSHSSHRQTADRVLVHVDTEKSEMLVNNRFAYVSVSRAQHDAHISTNDGSKLSRSLSPENSQRTVTEVEQQPATLKPEPVAIRGVRPSEEENGRCPVRRFSPRRTGSPVHLLTPAGEVVPQVC